MKMTIHCFSLRIHRPQCRWINLRLPARTLYILRARPTSNTNTYLTRVLHSPYHIRPLRRALHTRTVTSPLSSPLSPSVLLTTPSPIMPNHRPQPPLLDVSGIVVSAVPGSARAKVVALSASTRARTVAARIVPGETQSGRRRRVRRHGDQARSSLDDILSTNNGIRE
jgi:hypothetical protein